MRPAERNFCRRGAEALSQSKFERERGERIGGLGIGGEVGAEALSGNKFKWERGEKIEGLGILRKRGT